MVDGLGYRDCLGTLVDELMGALTSNRKRVDESFNLHSPCASINFHYSNQIDTRLSKKPKISSVIEHPEKLSLTPQSPVSRLKRYPEPAKPLPREIHAPHRTLKFGCSSSISGYRSRFSERVGSMGNYIGSLRRYVQAKKSAISTLQHVKPEPAKKYVSLDDSSDVEILEDDNEIRSVVFSDHRERERNGLALVLENEKLNEKALGGIVQASSSASDPIKVEHTEGFLPYKRLLGSVEKNFADKLRNLGFEINFNETKWESMRKEQSLRKAKEIKKPDELKKPVEDSFHQPFAPLTSEEENEVQHALSHSNRRKVLVTHENSNIQITGEMLQCLRSVAWLNDEIINVYMELLKEREKREPKKFLNCHFFNTFFYKKLIGGRTGYDYKSVRRWTTQRKLGYGLIECDKIFVPIHKEVHWCLAVINKKDEKFQYLDSMGGKDPHCLKVLAKYFVDEVKDKSGRDIDISSWEYEYVDDLPEQHNGYDCGVFMIKYADFYSRGMQLEFSQENMPYFRMRTAKEILRLRAD